MYVVEFEGFGKELVVIEDDGMLGKYIVDMVMDFFFGVIVSDGMGGYVEKEEVVFFGVKNIFIY